MIRPMDGDYRARARSYTEGAFVSDVARNEKQMGRREHANDNYPADLAADGSRRFAHVALQS